MKLYTTEEQAAADAGTLAPLHQAGAAPLWLIRLAQSAAGDPRASFDTLTIVAEAFREVAHPLEPCPMRRAVFALASNLERVAQSRANPLEI